MPLQTAAPSIIPLILSGGSGTRLWPVSREDCPKQFFGLLDARHSLLEDTIHRVSDPSLFAAPVVMGNQAHRHLIREQLERSGVTSPQIIIEPCGRNTAPAITAAALLMQARANALMLVLPTDHCIKNTEAFLAGIREGVEAAHRGYLVTFGITPSYPETGYGYIRRGNTLEKTACRVESFVEKPDRETAQRYLIDGNYFWNSGMFLFSPALLLQEMEKFCPDILEACREAIAHSAAEEWGVRLNESFFSAAPAVSIDYALMERTEKAALIPLDCGWSDTGEWESLWRLSPKDNRENVTIGQCHPVESRSCYLRNEHGPVVATYGVENLVIVATKDVVLVTHKHQAHALKTLVDHVRKTTPELVAHNSHVYRPWGMYESLDMGPRHQVKRIHVKPGEKLSLQMHYHRAEHWIVIAGTAKVVCGEKECLLMENQSIHIPMGSVHRIENPGKIPLEIIEVQSGPYLGEDDIVRFEDVYGRAEQKKVA